MVISSLAFYLYIIFAALGGFAVGVWIQRFFVWYPFGQHPLTGREAMIGKSAVVAMVKPAYMEVRFNSQIWRAITSDQEPLEVGDSVVIHEVRSNILVVGTTPVLNTQKKRYT